MQLIILAAGRGSRLPKKFRKRPKCLTLINKKSIIDHNLNFYKKFKSKWIVTGYKNYHLKNFCEKNNFSEIFNDKYKSTNMVHSLFLTSKFIKKDVIICYGDVVFDPKIYKLLKYKSNLIPVNINWFKNWKKRMTLKNIWKDAENIVIEKNYLKSIGGPIKEKIPRYQYMGIFKITKKRFNILHSLYKKINNKKIDMTSFLNLAVSEKKLKLKTIKYKSYWYEIDTSNDLKVAEKGLI